jgi:hypothetical protein
LGIVGLFLEVPWGSKKRCEGHEHPTGKSESSR